MQDTRPGASSMVYCKGCGEPLESRARLEKTRAAVVIMMCDACQEVHGHQLMPKPGSQTFCYRCGRPDEIFQVGGTTPAVYHVCPHCVPERATRYRAGDFEEPKPAAAETNGWGRKTKTQ